MGIFAGDLQFTVYKGTNLVRMDAAAKTNEPWVAYKYDAGLKGFSTDLTPRVTWRDTGGHPQNHQFGGAVNTTLARVRAQNRLILAEAKRRRRSWRSRHRIPSSSRERRIRTSATCGTGRMQKGGLASASASPSVRRSRDTCRTSHSTMRRPARCRRWACISMPVQTPPSPRDKR